MATDYNQNNGPKPFKGEGWPEEKSEHRLSEALRCAKVEADKGKTELELDFGDLDPKSMHALEAQGYVVEMFKKNSGQALERSEYDSMLWHFRKSNGHDRSEPYWFLLRWRIKFPKPGEEQKSASLDSLPPAADAEKSP